MVRLLDPRNGYIGPVKDLFIFILILLSARVYGNNWHTPNVFYDTNVLPEEKEITTYLLRNEIKTVFVLPDDDNPVVIIVTPCASAIEWNITYKAKSYNGNETSLHHSIAEGRETFTISGEGIYTLALRAIRSDTRVHFYVTKNRFSDFYPALPTDHRVEGAVVQRRRISVSWKASPEETPFDNVIEYCISISKGRDYPTYCSLKAHLFGDSYLKPPKGAGFGFNREKQRERERERNARPVRAVKKGQIVYRCVGSKTNFMYTRARPNTKYYINVHIINNRTNQSSTYTGLELRTMKGKKIKTLKYDKMNKLALRKPKQKELLMFDLKTFTSKLFLVIHSCSGKVKFQVIRKGKTIVNSRIRNIKKLTLRDLEPDVYRVKVTNSGKGVRNVKVFISNNTRTFHQYPELPNDTRLVVYSTCTNVTITWLEASQRQMYCFYKKEIAVPPTKRKRRRTKVDSCKISHLKSSEKIICKRFNKRHRHRQTGVSKFTISDLKPGTFYKFDVVVKRRKRYQIPYQSVVTQTKSVC